MTPSDTHANSLSHRVLDDLVGITENLTSGADPADLLRELLLATGMTWKNPSGIVAANTHLARGSARAFRAAVDRALGRDNPGPIAIPSGDRRFSDTAYQENPAYFLLAQQHLLLGQFVAELLDTAGASGTRETKARFAARFLVDALAPTNTFWLQRIPSPATPRRSAEHSTPAARA
jgi:poly[(R)-3-hydroxyalkanoate] polymerase subunit PhaC